jgi:MFS family permease
MTAIATVDAIPAAPPAGAYRPTRWGTVILLSLVLLVAGTLGLAMTPLQESLRIELGFTDMQMTLIMGVAKGLPMALLSVPVGLAVDHANRARLVFFFGLCWTIGTFWTAFATGFVPMILARALVGFAVGSLLGAVLSLIADICMPEKRGRVMLVAGIGSWLGAAFAFGFGGTLFGYFSVPGTGLIDGLSPWRQTVFAFGLVGAAMLIPMAFIREPARFERELRDNRIGPALRAIWKRRWFLIPLFLGSITGGIAEGAAALWSAAVLSRKFGLQPSDFGAWMGAVIFFGGVGGSIIGGFVADWGSKLERRGGVLIGAVVATALSIPAGAFTVMPSVPLYALMLALLLTGGAVVALVGSTAVTVLIPNEERGTVMAIMTAVSTLLALGAAPAVIALGIWLYGDEGHLAETVAIVGVGTGLVSLAGYVVAMINAPERPVASTAGG